MYRNKNKNWTTGLSAADNAAMKRAGLTNELPSGRKGRVRCTLWLICLCSVPTRTQRNPPRPFHPSSECASLLSRYNIIGSRNKARCIPSQKRSTATFFFSVGREWHRGITTLPPNVNLFHKKPRATYEVVCSFGQNLGGKQVVWEKLAAWRFFYFSRNL